MNDGQPKDKMQSLQEAMHGHIYEEIYGRIERLMIFSKNDIWPIYYYICDSTEEPIATRLYTASLPNSDPGSAMRNWRIWEEINR